MVFLDSFERWVGRGLTRIVGGAFWRLIGLVFLVKYARSTNTVWWDVLAKLGVFRCESATTKMGLSLGRAPSMMHIEVLSPLPPGFRIGLPRCLRASRFESLRPQYKRRRLGGQGEEGGRKEGRRQNIRKHVTGGAGTSDRMAQ